MVITKNDWLLRCAVLLGSACALEFGGVCCGSCAYAAASTGVSSGVVSTDRAAVSVAHSTSGKAEVHGNVLSSAFHGKKHVKNVKKVVGGVKKHVGKQQAGVLRSGSIVSGGDVVNKRIVSIRNEISRDEESASQVVKSDSIPPSVMNKKKETHYIIDVPGTKFVIGGSIDVEFGAISQKKDFRNIGNPYAVSDVTKACTNKRCNTPSSGLVENAKLKLMLDKTEKDIEYGLFFKMNANPGVQSDGYVGNDVVYGYAQGGFGRVEAGSNFGVNQMMKIDAASVAVGPGGIDGDYTDWTSDGRGAFYKSDAITNKPDVSGLFVNDPYMSYEDRTSKKANKITYISPDFGNFKFGVSYVPHTRIRGTDFNVRRFFGGQVYTNVVEAVAKYEINTDARDKFGFGASIGGEIGHAQDFAFKNGSGTSVTEEIRKVDKLRAWNVGTEFTYKGFVLVGSYGDSGKSGMFSEYALADGLKKEQKYWTSGIAYNSGKFGASVTFLESHSSGLVASYSDAGGNNSFPGYCSSSSACTGQTTGKKKNNRYRALSVGAQYQILEGLLSYAEVTRFNYSSPFTNVETNSGNVFLVSTKVSF